MAKLYLMCGLSASGKSTLAKELQEKRNEENAPKRQRHLK
jgi:predicted kinase